MKFERKKIAVALAYALGAGSTLMVAAPSQAADISVSVTGTNIRRTDVETASPVQVLTSADLEKSGYSTVSEVLRDITANSNGLLSQGFGRAFAGGASGVALRGLSVGNTLVLVDGLRMAGYPTPDDNQHNFVDISSIPFSAVERIEILLDGASAIYGSDAIGGVVNVILKKSYTGTGFTVEGGSTFKGGGTTWHASIAQGFGDAGGPASGYLVAEVRHQDSIKLKQRSGDALNFDWTSVGGVDLRPGANAPSGLPSTPYVLGAPYLFRPGGNTANPADYAFLNDKCDFTRLRAGQCLYTDTWSVIQPETQNINLLGRLNGKLGDNWSFTLDGSYFYSEATNPGTHYAARPQGTFGGNVAFGPGVPVAILNPISLTNNPFGGFRVPASYPGNPFGVPAYPRALLEDRTGREDNFETGTTRVVAQLNGTYSGWNINVAGGYTKAREKIKRTNYVNFNNWMIALNDPVNPFNLLGGNSDEMMDFVSPTVTNTATNQLSFIQAVASGDLMKLDGGPLAMAFGAGYVYQKLNFDNSSECKAGEVFNINCAYSVGKQSNTNIYAELNAPVLKTLELNAAVRYDYYDTYGGQAVPKFGFKWTPWKEAAFRGTWGKGFRAPYMAESGEGLSRFGAPAARDPLLCPVNGADGKADLTSSQNVPTYCNFSVPFLGTTNPDLKAEKSTNWNVGMVLEPVKNWSTTLDYYSIKLDNQIITAASAGTTFDIFSAPVRSAPQQLLYGDGVTRQSSVGYILYVASPYINVGTTETTGIDLASFYTWDLSPANRLKFGVNWSHLFNYDVTVYGVKYKLAGTHGPGFVSGNTGTPKDRLQLTGQWFTGPFTTTLMGNYVGKYDLTDPLAGINTCDDGINAFNNQRFANTAVYPQQYCTVKGFWYWNLNLKWQYDKQTTFQLSVTNLFNNKAPVDMGSYAGSGFNQTSNQTGGPHNSTFHGIGAVGTAWVLGLNYQF
jgi:iron complex outermembrane receptor protein